MEDTITMQIFIPVRQLQKQLSEIAATVEQLASKRSEGRQVSTPWSEADLNTMSPVISDLLQDFRELPALEHRLEQRLEERLRLRWEAGLELVMEYYSQCRKSLEAQHSEFARVTERISAIEESLSISLLAVAGNVSPWSTWISSTRGFRYWKTCARKSSRTGSSAV